MGIVRGKKQKVSRKSLQCSLKNVARVIFADSPSTTKCHQSKVEVSGLDMDKPQKEESRVFVNSNTIFYRDNSNY